MGEHDDFEVVLNQWMPLVRKSAAAVSKRLRGLRTYDEMVAVCYEAVWLAHRTYDETKGASFATWVVRLVKQAMCHEIEYWAKGKRSFMTNVVWIDDDEHRVDLYDAEGSPDRTVEFENTLMAIERALESLPERSRDILFSRARGETLREISDRFGVSKERVRQLEEKGIEAVRKRVLGKCSDDEG